jgi:hypothetical protein
MVRKAPAQTTSGGTKRVRLLKGLSQNGYGGAADDVGVTDPVGDDDGSIGC